MPNSLYGVSSRKRSPTRLLQRRVNISQLVPHWKMAKRVRKPNFSAAERAALIKEFSLRRSVLQQKFKTNSANKEKQKAWLEICEAINSVSKASRSVGGGVKEKWSKLSSEARVQLRARKYPPPHPSPTPTGSGQVDEMPDLHLFKPIFGDSDLIEGIGEDVGGFDSGNPAPNQGKPLMWSRALWQIASVTQWMERDTVDLSTLTLSAATVCKDPVA